MKANKTKINMITDYLGDCRKGYKDVSLRISHIDLGETFTFICSFDQVVKMAMVINFRKGQIVEKQETTNGMIITVGKKSA